MLHNWSIYMNFFQFQFILILLSRIHIPIHILFAVQFKLNSIIICNLIPNSVRTALVRSWCNVVQFDHVSLQRVCVCVCVYTCTCCHTYEKRLGKKGLCWCWCIPASLLEEMAVYLADRSGAPVPLLCFAGRKGCMLDWAVHVPKVTVKNRSGVSREFILGMYPWGEDMTSQLNLFLSYYSLFLQNTIYLCSIHAV